MKSALELAMEKTAAIGQKAREELGRLSPAQRKEIEEIKKTYEGKIAEKDVLFQQELGKLTGGVPIEAVETALPPEALERVNAVRGKFREEREALETERDEKIEAVKREGQGPA